MKTVEKNILKILTIAIIFAITIPISYKEWAFHQDKWLDRYGDIPEIQLTPNMNFEIRHQAFWMIILGVACIIEVIASLLLIGEIVEWIQYG